MKGKQVSNKLPTHVVDSLDAFLASSPFSKSDALAAAVMLFIAVPEEWRWGALRAAREIKSTESPACISQLVATSRPSASEASLEVGDAIDAHLKTRAPKGRAQA